MDYLSQDDHLEMWSKANIELFERLSPETNVVEGTKYSIWDASLLLRSSALAISKEQDRALLYNHSSGNIQIHHHCSIIVSNPRVTS